MNIFGIFGIYGPETKDVETQTFLESDDSSTDDSSSDDSSTNEESTSDIKKIYGPDKSHPYIYNISKITGLYILSYKILFGMSIFAIVLHFKPVAILYGVIGTYFYIIITLGNRRYNIHED